MLTGVSWLGHASFRIKKRVTIYIDPWKLAQPDPEYKADVILVTHTHHDHLSPKDIAAISKSDTVIVTTPDAKAQLADFAGDIKLVAPGDKLTVKGVSIQAVPAYNVDKQFHPKSKEWVGFVFTVDDVTFYHTGDTDLIEEMGTITTDVAFLPVSGTYVMTADEAVEATQRMTAKMAIPMHYGEIVGTLNDANRFKQKCSIDVTILERSRP